MRLAALKAGNALTITGGKMTEADRIAEISSLEDTVDNLTKHREQLTSTINEYSKTAAGLKTPTSKETKPEVTSTLDTSKYNFTKEADAATREGYKKVMAHAKSMLKTNPQEAERIQKEAQKRMIDAKLLVKAS
jgi:prefoldin subunit 5